MTMSDFKTKAHEVFTENGVWVRWLISVVLGLGSVGTSLFFLGQWTKGVQSDITALQREDVIIVGRLDVVEKTIGEGMTIRIKLQKDVEYIREKVDKSELKQDKVIDLLNAHMIQGK
jgi:hypothetical protein